ncbi:MAG: hypothetical protein N2C12_04690, partial [Planctomycetales bacterium]
QDTCGTVEHLIAHYAMAEALLAMDMAMTEGPNGGYCPNYIGEGACSVDPVALRSSVTAALNFTIGDRHPYHPTSPPKPPASSSSPYTRNKGGWRYDYWDSTFPDVNAMPWGVMAVRASEMAGIEIPEHPAGTHGETEYAIVQHALDTIHVNPIEYNGEWLGRQGYDYWPEGRGTGSNNHNIGGNLCRLLCGSSPDHPAITEYLDNTGPGGNMALGTFWGRRAAELSGAASWDDKTLEMMQSLQVNPGQPIDPADPSSHNNGSIQAGTAHYRYYDNTGRFLAVCMAVAAMAEVEQGMRLTPAQ